MILIIHNNYKAIKAVDDKQQDFSINTTVSITKTLFIIAEAFPEELIIWCHTDYLDFIDLSNISNIFHHNSIMASYAVSNEYFIPSDLGYVDPSIFLNVKKGIRYPTWLMSSDVGGIHASVLILNADQINFDDDFDYFLNSFAKLAMPKGLFCYSEPNLIKADFKATIKTKQASKYDLFKFVKQHYKWAWVFMLFFCYLIYAKKLILLPFLKSLFYKKVNIDFKNTKIDPANHIKIKKEIDVIIPTIVRKQYLYDVLKDLASQTLLPKHVIIVEQNPEQDSNSELDYLENETWPFKIKHTFISKTGACNARNLALKQIESNWVFLADDDIRFKEDMLEIALKEMLNYKLNAVTISCLRKGDKKILGPILQWNTFGSGCSIISKDIAKSIVFDTAFEHGFGEDADFGMQIRNLGEDIGFVSKQSLLHLKAPIGGFRTKHVQPWEDDKIQPKPSPTIMLFNLKNKTNKQLLGYKTLLFINFFKSQKNKNIFSYFKIMKKRWERSLYWANKLKNTYN